MVGMRTGKKFRMGDQVTIKVVSANLGKRQLDYHWIPAETTGKVADKKTKTKVAPAKKSKAKK